MSIGEVGCYLSHMWCLNDIIKNNIKNAIIFEDDIVVRKNFENLYTLEVCLFISNIFRIYRNKTQISFSKSCLNLGRINR